MNKETLERNKKKLEEKRKELRKMLERFANEDTKPEGDWDTRFPKLDDGGDLEESADEVEEYASLLSVEYSLEKRLKKVDDALESIKKGEYGKCKKCNKEISKERLELIPEAQTCKDCSNQ